MDLKQKLSGAQWRLHVRRTLNIDGEDVEVVIRRPPESVLLGALEAAKKAEEMDAEHRPTSEVASMRVLARFTALCLFAPDGVRPLYSAAELDAVFEAPWLLQLQEDVTGAVSHATTLVKVAEGNSGATPS